MTTSSNHTTLVALSGPQTNKTLIDSRSVAKKRYIEAATSENTRISYQSAIRHYQSFGGTLPATVDEVASYLVAYAGTLNSRTLEVRLSALSKYHKTAHFDDPTDSSEIKTLLNGIKRLHGKPKKRAFTFTLVQFKQILDHLTLKGDTKSLRDLALLNVAFFGAYRRCEVAALRIEDLKFSSEGVDIVIPTSKTDIFNEGITKLLRYGKNNLCPITTTKAWLLHAGIEAGPLFRTVNRWGTVGNNALTPQSINLILSSTAKEAGLDFYKKLSGHSFRRSLATAADRSGASFASIKAQGGWVKDSSVYPYIESVSRYKDNVMDTLISN